MLKIKNFDKLKADLQRAVEESIQRDALPVVRGLIYSAAERMVKGYEGYVGTPQWSGNAAANWYFTEGQPATNFVEVFDKPLDVRAAFSASNPNRSAQDESLSRVTVDLQRYQGGLAFLTNTAPYLSEYEQFGGPNKFRLSNLFPFVPAAAGAEMLLEAREMTKGKAEEYKLRWRT